MIAAVGVVVVGIVASAALLGQQTLGIGRDADPSAIDTYRASDAEFFSQFSVTTSPVLGSYDSLEAAAQSVSVVIVAEVVDVRAGHTVGPKVDEFHTYYLVLQPNEVLQGELPAEYERELTVMFPAGQDDPGEDVERMRDALPEGKAVWFLRSGAELYESIEASETAQDRALPDYVVKQREAEKNAFIVAARWGLFVQGRAGVTTPFTKTDDAAGGEDAGRQGTGYDNLSELVRYLRRIDGWHGTRPDPQSGPVPHDHADFVTPTVTKST